MTKMPVSPVLAVALFVYFGTLAALDSPARGIAFQIFYLVFIVIVLVFFGYETYYYTKLGHASGSRAENIDN